MQLTEHFYWMSKLFLIIPLNVSVSIQILYVQHKMHEFPFLYNWAYPKNNIFSDSYNLPSKSTIKTFLLITFHPNITIPSIYFYINLCPLSLLLSFLPNLWKRCPNNLPLWFLLSLQLKKGFLNKIILYYSLLWFMQRQITLWSEDKTTSPPIHQGVWQHLPVMPFPFFALSKCASVLW